MPRVGSEFRDESRDRAQWALRQEFLRAVETLAPSVLQDLLGTVLPAYRMAATEGALPTLWKWDRQGWERVDPRAHPHTAQLRATLLVWGAQHRLEEDWLLDVALRTAWEQHEWEQEAWERRQEWELEDAEIAKKGLPPAVRPPDPPAPLGFASVSFADIETVTPFRFKHEAWVPQWRTWQEYVAGLQRAFGKALLCYRRALEDEAERRGMILSPEKRDVNRHLAWLVHFQVDGRTYNEIALGPGGADVRTVQRAIRDLAQLTGLTLRKKRPPRKSPRRQ